MAYERGMKRIWIWAVLAACHGRSDKRITITYDIDLDHAVHDRAVEVKRQLDDQFRQDKIDAKVAVDPLAVIAVTPTDATKRGEIEAKIKETYRDQLASHACAQPDAICFEIGFKDAIKKAALANAVKVVQARVDASDAKDAHVSSKGDQLVIDAADGDPEKLTRMRDLVARSAKLEFKAVDDGSDFMKRVFAHVGATKTNEATDPAALAAEIRADVDSWQPEGGGAHHLDYYLVAHDREEDLDPGEAKRIGCPRPPCAVTGRMVIERYLAALAQADPTFRVPDDRQILFEQQEPQPEAKDRRPQWRSYFVERVPGLTGKAIANATASTDPSTHAPTVMLDFSRDGARTFGELTQRLVGKKLAIVLDGNVKSAPLLMSAIRGGRASITMGKAAQQPERAATELAISLKSGALPAPLVEVSVSHSP